MFYYAGYMTTISVLEYSTVAVPVTTVDAKSTSLIRTMCRLVRLIEQLDKVVSVNTLVLDFENVSDHC
jgi:hypothetical protein